MVWESINPIILCRETIEDDEQLSWEQSSMDSIHMPYEMNEINQKSFSLYDLITFLKMEFSNLEF
jgi:hypothetical protein